MIDSRVLRSFLVTHWGSGLLKVSVDADHVLDAIHILERAGVRPQEILSIREVTREDSITGLQRAVP